jgi:hypothetical protein
VTYILVGGAALIIFLIWRLSVVSSERNEAIAASSEWHRRYLDQCEKLARGHELQQDAIREAQEFLDPPEDDPSYE